MWRRRRRRRRWIFKVISHQRRPEQLKTTLTDSPQWHSLTYLSNQRMANRLADKVALSLTGADDTEKAVFKVWM